MLAMTYSNILVRPGMEKFMYDSKQCGLDGFILPDLPVDEAGTYSVASKLKPLCSLYRQIHET